MSWRPSASIETLVERAAALRRVHEFFAAREVIEVHTPLLAAHTVTDPDVEGIEVPGYGFLQTSPEYFMKRLLAAGMGSCYQLLPAFRADEVGRLHDCEFLMLEWYRLAFDDRMLMHEVSELVDVLLGAQPYRHMTYAEVVGAVHGNRAELDLAFADAVAGLQGRVFITDYPADQAALARLNADDPTRAARFELIVDGIEIANGYWELKDPQEHRRRFAADNQVRANRGRVERQWDENFLAALDEGLPDCAGVALGLDRLMMIALELPRLSDVMAFPGGDRVS